ncbi:unnamed protein product [Ambrosiozyma monospora]|uniref:Unnamed protein product n=1 Tax=Ambrosiozyma monospora TaxID=43982 RepID=A0ACB5UDI8_AMBMO|nr:unnamed protein product [Ambrosiozyma monospora]
MTKAKLNPSEMSDEERAKTENFSDSMINKIVDNVQVTIRNIHLRYEDEHVFTQQPYAVGLTLEELSAVSADESWMSGFISSFSSIARKLLTLKSLTMYWTTENESIYTDDHDALLEIFKLWSFDCQ